MSKLNVRAAISNFVDYDEGISLADSYIEDAADILVREEERDEGFLDYLEDKYCYRPLDEIPDYVKETLGWGEYAEAAREEWDRLKAIAHGYERWAAVMVA